MINNLINYANSFFTIQASHTIKKKIINTGQTKILLVLEHKVFFVLKRLLTPSIYYDLNKAEGARISKYHHNLYSLAVL